MSSRTNYDVGCYIHTRYALFERLYLQSNWIELVYVVALCIDCLEWQRSGLP